MEKAKRKPTRPAARYYDEYIVESKDFDLNGCGIYCLFDARDPSLRYIGHSMCLSKRMKQHFYLFRSGNHHCKELQKLLKNNNVKHLRMKVLENCHPDVRFSREEWYLRNLENVNTCRFSSAPQGVFQFTRVGDFIAEFESIKQASEETGISRSSISSAAIGYTFTAGGYFWSERRNLRLVPGSKIIEVVDEKGKFWNYFADIKDILARVKFPSDPKILNELKKQSEVKAFNLVWRYVTDEEVYQKGFSKERKSSSK